MDVYQEDAVMEGLPMRQSDVSTFDREKSHPVIGMNGNADPSLAPSLLNTFQRPFPLPRGRAPPSESVAQASSRTPATQSTSTKSEDDSESLDLNMVESDEDVALKGLPLASLPTGLCYDVRMRYHTEIRPKQDIHPEDPRRILYIFKELCRAGLATDDEYTSPLVDIPLKRIEARDATREEVCLVHTPAHYEFVQSTQHMTDEDLISHENDGQDSIYYNTLTWRSAILSCGGAIETCRAVVARKVKNAIAVIRPPGHHAEVHKAMGFCLFNNTKILILDWDVHHGNGVQKVFYDDPNVLYISLHVFQNGHFYPGEPDGGMDYCGRGAGVGKNINIPWPTQGMGDGDYLFAFQQIVMPIATEFDPDLVIVAAGFDAAAGDELGGCFVTPACYAHMTHMLMALANGKVAVCLEGGYNFRSISKSALAVTRTLMGEPPDRLVETSPSDDGVETVRRVQLRQSRYWRCMFPKDVRGGALGERMHDIVRHSQSKHLYDNYKMTSLYIYRDRISKSFENQVLATPHYDSSPAPLLVIFHDPPDLAAIPDPVSNKLQLHNTFLTDPLKDYIHWAVSKHQFSVIDVNIPTHLTGLDTPRSSPAMTAFTTAEKEAEMRASRQSATEELASYLWENHIEPYSPSEIFFLGIGDAFAGLASLLTTHEHVSYRISGVVTFVADQALRPISSPTMSWLSKWYINHSLVFVSPIHNVWNQENVARKPSKRYGKLVRSDRARLGDMMVWHREEVFRFLLERSGRPVEEDSDDEEEGLEE